MPVKSRGSGLMVSGGGAFSGHSLGCYNDPVFKSVSPSNTTPGSVIPADPDRIYLAFVNSQATVQVAVNFITTFTQFQGYLVPTQSYPLEFNREDHGPLVTKEWFSISSGVGATLNIITISCNCCNDSDRHSKVNPRKLYERAQSNLSLHPDNGFLIGRAKPASDWLATITSPVKPLLNTTWREPSGIRRGINNGARGKSSRLVRDFWLND